MDRALTLPRPAGGFVSIRVIQGVRLIVACGRSRLPGATSPGRPTGRDVRATSAGWSRWPTNPAGSPRGERRHASPRPRVREHDEPGETPVSAVITSTETDSGHTIQRWGRRRWPHVDRPDPDATVTAKAIEQRSGMPSTQTPTHPTRNNPIDEPPRRFPRPQRRFPPSHARNARRLGGFLLHWRPPGRNLVLQDLHRRLSSP